MPSHTPPQERTNYFFKITTIGFILFWFIILCYTCIQGIICFIKNENPDEFYIIVIHINSYITFLLYLYIVKDILEIYVLNEKPNEEEPKEDLYTKTLFDFIVQFSYVYWTNFIVLYSYITWTINLVYCSVQLIISHIKNENINKFYLFNLRINMYGIFFLFLYIYIRKIKKKYCTYKKKEQNAEKEPNDNKV